MTTLYFAGALLTFGVLLNAFLRDESTPKTHFYSWLVLLVATLLWFLVAPSLLWRTWRKPMPKLIL